MEQVIYQGWHGKMVKLNEPRLPQNANFVIKWQGMDWSGFRTLAECERQFPELESRDDVDNFQVVET